MTIIFVLVGLLFIGLSIPLMARRVPPNQFYGLRVHETFKSERVWYDANVAGGRYLLLFGVVIVGAAVLMDLRGIGELTRAAVLPTLLLVGTIAMAVRGKSIARRLAKKEARSK